MADGQAMKERFSTVVMLICAAVLMDACAHFKKPATIEDGPVRERAVTQEGQGVQASVSVVGSEEARQIFGIDLFRKNIQAVWVEVANNADRPIILLPTAIDPEYFSPYEVAFTFHGSFAADSNAMLDKHLMKLAFPVRSPILQGSRAAGYIFTNASKGLKVIDIDLIGDDFSQNFTFFAGGPNSMKARAVIEGLDTMFQAVELQNVQSEDDLRQALEQLPCCVSNEIGGTPAEPLNVVIIGSINDWATAFMRRGYRYQALNPRYVFGRGQDISAHKMSQGFTKVQAYTIRLWQVPIRYRGRPVWIGQTSLRQGGRFAKKAPAEVTLPLDPNVDEARNNLVQDLAYSQALVKIGYIKGSGQAQPTTAEKRPGEVLYTTDGLRGVLVFGDRPSSLETIDFFDWERLGDFRQEDPVRK